MGDRHDATTPRRHEEPPGWLDGDCEARVRCGLPADPSLSRGAVAPWRRGVIPPRPHRSRSAKNPRNRRPSVTDGTVWEIATTPRRHDATKNPPDGWMGIARRVFDAAL